MFDIHIQELSLLFSYRKTTNLKIAENKLVIGSRPVSGRDLSSYLLGYRRLAVPTIRISDRTGLRPFSYSFQNEIKKVFELIDTAHVCHQFLFLQQR